MKRAVLTFIALTVLCLPTFLSAQWAIGPHILISVPTSDFANVSGVGGGFGFKVVRRIDALGGIGLRGDFAFLNYERTFETIPSSIGFLVAEVRNQAFRLTVGPDFTFGKENLKFNAGVSGGLYFFQTDLNISTGGFGVLRDTRDEDIAVGWNFGGGFLYDIGLGPWLDVSVRYQTIFNLPSSATVTNAEGVEEEIRQNITAHEFTVKLGVIFFIGK